MNAKKLRDTPTGRRRSAFLDLAMFVGVLVLAGLSAVYLVAMARDGPAAMAGSAFLAQSCAADCAGPGLDQGLSPSREKCLAPGR